MKGIVFDFGGVITLPQDETFYARVEARFGWTRAAVRAGWKKFRRLMDADIISIEELYLRMAAEEDRELSPAEAEEIGRWDYDSWAIPNPQTIEWIKTLKQQGYKVGILTNMPSNFVPWFERCAGEARRIVDAELISGTVHLAKPAPEIYRLMEERMALPPEDLLFFDDLVENVQGAVACGWHGAVFTTVEAAQQALIEHGF